MKYLIVFLFLLFSGCSNIKYDNIQFDRTLELKLFADEMDLQCYNNEIIKQKVIELKEISDYQFEYSKYKNNDELSNSYLIIKEMVNSMYIRYKKENPSELYCRNKLKMISHSLEIILKEIGNF